MSVRVKLLTSFALAGAILIVLSVLHQQNINRLTESRWWVEHTQTVLEKLEKTMTLMKDEEASARDFIVTHDAIFLEPYDRAKAKVIPTIGQIKTLTADNPTQQSRAERLEDLFAARTALLERFIADHKSSSAQSQDLLASMRQGKELADQVRTLVVEMQGEERMLLTKRLAEADTVLKNTLAMTMLGTVLALLVVLGAGLIITNYFARSVRKIQSSLESIGQGNLDTRVEVSGADEFGKLAQAFNGMADRLSISTQSTKELSWLNESLARFANMLQGQKDLSRCAQMILKELAETLNSRHGLFYVADTADGAHRLSLLASFAHQERKNMAGSFAPGEGLVGQCALEKQRIVLTDAPDDYITIASGLGEARPANIALVPVIFEGNVKAVLEQSSFSPFTPLQLDFLDRFAATMGVTISTMEASQRTVMLLQQEQALTEELKSQQERLSDSNKQLEKSTSSLQASEEELRQQQEELQQTNEELEEKSRIQSEQNLLLEAKNIELEQLRIEMQEKARELTVTSKYKSEFLANMSHELRTPLNSLLILSKVLFENQEGNLSGKQVEFARTIYSAGFDLLSLIDDVLDISKIEAGAMGTLITEESIKDICAMLMSHFGHMAKEKGVDLAFNLSSDLPRFVNTDGRRLQQILKNLLSNAMKFTEKGSVTLNVQRASNGWPADNADLNAADEVLAFSVVDTGIGIAREKQSVIFEAFQQADGTTSRKYGGTGLGLAICRELAALLGGQITLQSEPGHGSNFTLFLPRQYKAVEEGGTAKGGGDSKIEAAAAPTASSAAVEAGSDDDRGNIAAGDRILLIVDQETEFVEQLTGLAHSRGFKVLSTRHGKTALVLARKYKPDAITVDLALPDRDGWTFLDRIKRDPTTRHIPVQIISLEDRVQQAKRLGAIGYLSKPASREGLNEALSRLSTFAERKQRHLLIVEDNSTETEHLISMIEGPDVKVTAVDTGAKALTALGEHLFDCVVLDLGLPDMSGFEVLARAKSEHTLNDTPVIVYTSRSLTAPQETELRLSTEAIIVKGKESADRLLDETTLFLHRVESNLPENKRKLLEKLHTKDAVLSGRKVLIVDDDVRHIFAVTTVLEQYDMNVLYAENGRQALEVLAKEPGIDVVLMDVMMPEMDGFDCMRAIRTLERYRQVPVIALTAKAMKGDRDECIAAGASDYLSKPIDPDQLLSLMRVWLY